jgi:ribosomal protein S8
MKKHLMVLVTLIFLVGFSCNEKIDLTKEKEAIKAVFEEEKNGFLNQDYVRMSETWIQEPSSVKITMTDKGQTKLDGWDAVSKEDQRATKDNSWDRKLVTVNFANYQIDVMNTSAWVMCETHWNGIFNNDTINLVQTRINVLKKIDGKWKFALMAIYNPPTLTE